MPTLRIPELLGWNEDLGKEGCGGSLNPSFLAAKESHPGSGAGTVLGPGLQQEGIIHMQDSFRLGWSAWQPSSLAPGLGRVWHSALCSAASLGDFSRLGDDPVGAHWDLECHWLLLLPLTGQNSCLKTLKARKLQGKKIN